MKAIAQQRQEQKESIRLTVVLFLIGLSVILSYQWWENPPSFRPDAPIIIFFGILVAAIIYLATTFYSGRLRFCPECGRQIPFDANLCPYCGHRFP